MNEINITKQEMRKKYQYIRKNIKNKQTSDEIIFQKVIHHKLINQAKTILTYVSIEEEVNTKKIIQYFLRHNKQVAVPKIENGIMNFYYINNLNELANGYYKILEPITNHLVTNFDNSISLTPGICFSKDLYRIGYGKGYYDKFYSHNDIYSIGLCYKISLVETVPYLKTDKQVNEIITD